MLLGITIQNFQVRLFCIFVFSSGEHVTFDGERYVILALGHRSGLPQHPVIKKSFSCGGIMVLEQDPWRPEAAPMEILGFGVCRQPDGGRYLSQGDKPVRGTAVRPCSVNRLLSPIQPWHRLP